MQLLHMMQPVHKVKLPPLCDGEGTEQGMIEYLGTRSESNSTSGKDLIHLGNLRCDLGHDFF